MPRAKKTYRVRNMVFESRKACAAYFGLTPGAISHAEKAGRLDELGLPMMCRTLTPQHRERIRQGQAARKDIPTPQPPTLDRTRLQEMPKLAQRMAELAMIENKRMREVCFE